MTSAGTRPLHPGLVFAGGLMVVEFLLAYPLLATPLGPWEGQPFISWVQATLMGLFGSGLLVQELGRRRGPVRARAIIGASAAVLACDPIPLFLSVLFWPPAGYMRTAGALLEWVGWITAYSSLAVAWGCALARRASTGDPGAARTGRLWGGVLLFGVFLSLAGRGMWVVSIEAILSYGSSFPRLMAGVMNSLVMILVAWAGVESVRRFGSAEDAARGGRRVHRLSIGVLVATIAESIVSAIASPMWSIRALSSLWSGAWSAAGYAAAAIALAVGVAELLRERSRGEEAHGPS